jgi:hypothetical protein
MPTKKVGNIKLREGFATFQTQAKIEQEKKEQSN